MASQELVDALLRHAPPLPLTALECYHELGCLTGAEHPALLRLAQSSASYEGDGGSTAVTAASVPNSACFPKADHALPFLISQYLKKAGVKLAAMAVEEAFEFPSQEVSAALPIEFTLSSMYTHAQCCGRPQTHQEENDSTAVGSSSTTNAKVAVDSSTMELQQTIQRLTVEVEELRSKLSTVTALPFINDAETPAGEPSTAVVGVGKEQASIESESVGNSVACSATSGSPILAAPAGAGSITVANAEHVVGVFADRLPTIIESVHSAKKESLIPVLTAVIQYHPQSTVRSSLLYNYLHITKRPSLELRLSLVEGLVTLAKRLSQQHQRYPSTASSVMGSQQAQSPLLNVLIQQPPAPSVQTVIDEELINELWPLANHRYPEYRALALDCARGVVQYLSAETKVAVLQNLITPLSLDANVEVRQCAATALGSLWSVVAHKRKECFVDATLAFLRLSIDERHSVVLAMEKETEKILRISAEERLLMRDMAPHVLQAIHQALTPSTVDEPLGISQGKIRQALTQHQLETLVRLLGRIFHHAKERCSACATGTPDGQKEREERRRVIEEACRLAVFPTFMQIVVDAFSHDVLDYSAAERKEQRSNTPAAQPSTAQSGVTSPTQGALANRSPPNTPGPGPLSPHEQPMITTSGVKTLHLPTRHPLAHGIVGEHVHPTPEELHEAGPPPVLKPRVVNRLALLLAEMTSFLGAEFRQEVAEPLFLRTLRAVCPTESVCQEAPAAEDDSADASPSTRQERLKRNAVFNAIVFHHACLTPSSSGVFSWLALLFREVVFALSMEHGEGTRTGTPTSKKGNPLRDSSAMEQAMVTVGHLCRSGHATTGIYDALWTLFDSLGTQERVAVMPLFLQTLQSHHGSEQHHHRRELPHTQLETALAEGEGDTPTGTAGHSPQERRWREYEDAAMRTVWPAVLMLLNDDTGNIDACSVAVRSFGIMLKRLRVKEHLEKITTTFFETVDAFGAFTPVSITALAQLRTLIKEAPLSTRDEFLIPQLATYCSLFADGWRSVPRDLAFGPLRVLLETFTELAHSAVLSPSQVSSTLLPTLKLLQPFVDCYGANEGAGIKQLFTTALRDLQSVEATSRPQQPHRTFFEKMKHELSNIVKH